MERPNLNNVLECFVSIPDGKDNLESWHNYIECMRIKVIPLLNDLRKKGFIEWYSFLVHGNRHISATFAGPSNFYVHLRVEIVESAGMQQVQDFLPNFCIDNFRILSLYLNR